MSDGEKLINELNELKLKVAHNLDNLYDSLCNLENIYRLGAPNDNTCLLLQITVRNLSKAFYDDAKRSDIPSLPIQACNLENIQPIADKILKIQKKTKWSLLKPAMWRNAVVLSCINAMINVMDVTNSIQALVSRFNNEFRGFTLW